MIRQKIVFDSGNELAAYAAKQINYHVMGYYPITPSTQIAEQLDLYKAEGEHDISMIAAEGEHSAAGICYGASTGGGRVFNATSANGLLYALEQLPVQSGTRFPMVMNVACRTVSGPLSIKGDHSDIMYTLNSGWIILFADSPQMVYDLNLCAVRIGERVKLPVIVAFDGFFTSHQKRKTLVFEDDSEVQKFVGPFHTPYTALDMEYPVTIGSYMNEPDLINNKFQLHLAMEEAKQVIVEIFGEFGKLTGRTYAMTENYQTHDAQTILFILGSSFHTAKMAVDKLRSEGKKVGVFTANVLRPFPKEAIYESLKNAQTVVVLDRQDSYGAQGGNMSLEVKAALQEYGCTAKVYSRVYGLGGKDFFPEDAEKVLRQAHQKEGKTFDYIGATAGKTDYHAQQYFNPIREEVSSPGLTICKKNSETNRLEVEGGRINETTKMPKRLAPGHGACPGCGIPVNVNLLLKGIEGNVVLLFQTGCGMVVTTAYPKTSFKVNYVHNLFQNGAATMSGLVEMYHQKQRRGEMPKGKITFIMVSGDGGMDIGMGSALGAALRNNQFILMEYDNGGYMNTGYQLSYSTPKGAKSSTSHIGKAQYGKEYSHKDTLQIMAATNIPYVASAAECNPLDFIKKAAKAQKYSQEYGMAYLKVLSACPLNWGDNPRHERSVIQAGVDCCYFPLYEIEQGLTTLNYNPEKNNKKIPIGQWFEKMGRTKHLVTPKYSELLAEIQADVDKRWKRLLARNDSDIL